MNSELPKFHETFRPILDVLSEGQKLHSRELIRIVAEKYYSNLPIELLEKKTKSGDNLLNNRINWGKSYLKKGGYVDYPERGYVQITEKGLKNKAELTLNYLENEVSLSSFYTSDNHNSSNIESTIQTPNDATPQDLIDKGFTQIENATKIELLEKLKTIDPYYFEKVILILLKKMGYGDFIETTKSSDGGIDGIINEDKLGLDKIYIQAKRFTENKVREKDIRNFIGAMSGDTNKGVFVTTSLFDKGAEDKARNAHHKIILIDGNKLVDLMHEYNVGIQVKSIYEVKELDEDFFVSQ
jgi:restriction system protein